MAEKYSSKGRIGHHIAKEDSTLVECLMRHFALSPEEAARLISFGAVYHNRQRVLSNHKVTAGQYVRVHLQPRRFPVETINWRETVVHETAAFLVVHKPAGIPVHATLDNHGENVLHQLRETLGGSVYVTQRLDAEVGGLIVFARTQDFQREFNQLLVDRKVKKRYRALTTSPPDVGRHVHYMEPSERSPKTVAIDARPNWQECSLSVVKVEPAAVTVPAPEVFDVEIDLETGRTHQIRAQLGALGSPIIGDKMYGSRTGYVVDGSRLTGIALFSASTSWPGAQGKEWTFRLEPPWV
jgi:23S rRNA pseudouridine1911/1915/1917 synthase